MRKKWSKKFAKSSQFSRREEEASLYLNFARRDNADLELCINLAFCDHLFCSFVAIKNRRKKKIKAEGKKYIPRKRL